MKYYTTIDPSSSYYTRLTEPPFQVLCRTEHYETLICFGKDGLLLAQEALGDPERHADARAFLWDAKRRVYKINGANDMELQPYKQMRFAHRRAARQLKFWSRVAGQDKRVCTDVQHPTVIPDGHVPLFFRHQHYTYVKPGRTHPFRYSLYSPKSSQDLPILLYLHSGASFGASGIKPLIETLMLRPQLRKTRERFHLLVPQTGLAPEAYATEVDEDLSDVIHSIPHADISRIYVVGTSMGGCGAVLQCYRHPDRYAAAVPCVAWLQNLENNGEDADPYHSHLGDEAFGALARTPMWLGYGCDEQQRVQPLYEALAAQGADVRQTYFPRTRHNYAGSRFFLSQPWAKWLFSKQNKRI